MAKIIYIYLQRLYKDAQATTYLPMHTIGPYFVMKIQSPTTPIVPMKQN